METTSIFLINVTIVLLVSLLFFLIFYKKLKKRIVDLEKQNTELLEKNTKLANEISVLKNKNSELLFKIEHPSKFNNHQEVKEGVVLEKRLVDNSFPKCFLNPYFSTLFMLELTRAVVLRKSDPNTLEELKKFAKSKYWEYRVFNKKDNTEKWIQEKDLNKL